MRHKILCTDGLSKDGFSGIGESGLLDLVFHESLKHEELLRLIPDFDGLVVRSASEVSRDVIEAGGRLKLIARAGVGTDNIDLDAATEKGIFVINAPSGNTVSTAELTFAMILALSRKIPQAAHSMSEGRWDRKKFKGAEVAHKTLGIIGLGRVGREVAARAKAFRMNVVGYDPHLSEEQLRSLGVDPLSKDEIFRCADFITVHTPLTSETEDMITRREFALMKPTARVINCARGGIINEKDLADALRDRVIAGAALDVYTEEPFDGSIFKGIENCIMTPHLGASTDEAQDAVASEIASYVASFFADGISVNAVNLPQSSAGAIDRYSRHIRLAGQIGRLASQLLGCAADEIVFLSTAAYPSLVMLAALEGVLSISTAERVTIVNALQRARDRGIPVIEEIVDSVHDYENAIGVKLKSGDAEILVWGAIFEDGSAKIVKCGDYWIEIDPNGSILFVRNEDKPGMIGRICSVLGEEGVNIAEMQNVRKGPGKDALTIIGVDGTISDGALKRISGEKGISDVKRVHL